MVVFGFKAFDNKTNNRYGMHFDAKQIYSVDGEVKFGNQGNGFHMCTNLEDTLRYVNAMEEEVTIAEVIGYGTTVQYNDEYYGYYDMYACEKIYIKKFLSREEIIDMMLLSNDNQVMRFLMGFKLSDIELELFKLKFCNNKRVMDCISYYQESDLEVYSRDPVFVKKKGEKCE